MRHLKSILFLPFFILQVLLLNAQGIIVNEFSNGTSGDKEFVELLVIGSSTDPNSPVDLAGWIVDDNANNFGNNIGTANGYFTLGSCLNSVPPGVIIVIYNDGDLNNELAGQTEDLIYNDDYVFLPTNRLSVTSAYLIAGITSSLGLFFLYNISELVALIGAISLLFYAFLYTPLKPITSFSVYVGAIPGALPPMIGVVAARGEIDSLAIYLFLIQFLWQFPHFWAIAWKAYDEYANAGFYLLPQKGGRNNINAVTIFCSSIATVSLAIIGYFWLDISLLISCLIAIMGFGMVYFSYILMSDLSDKSALRLMFYTLIYLPVTFILLFF